MNKIFNFFFYFACFEIQSGKSVISNFLADATEISGGDYHPTQGVR